MREIKFRAWDKEGGSDGMILWDLIKKLGWLLEDLFEDDSIIPMQYTGLKDKNGKDIYEGDIVKVVKCGCGKNICTDFIPRVSEVKFLKKFIHPFGDSMEAETYQDNNNYEIIGNIYENPDLLSTQQSQE